MTEPTPGAVLPGHIEAAMLYAATLVHSHGDYEHSHVYDAIPHDHDSPSPELVPT